MKVLMFQERFAPLVRSHAKRQTIRPPRSRPFLLGEVISLRRWTGLAYRSPQLELAQGEYLGATPVEVIGLAVVVGGRLLTDAEREAFAVADGFSSGMELADWFENVHGLPFAGVLHRWLPIGAPG